MPQHKGFEPFMRIWVVQVTVSYHPTCFDNSICQQSLSCTDSRVVFFGDQQSHDDFINYIAGQVGGSRAARIIRLVRDYGQQKWWNDKVWILFTLQNVYINGNFDPTFRPVIG